MSVALWLDQSLSSRASEIASAVKATVGYQEKRDSFEQSTFAIPTVEEPVEGEEVLGEDGLPVEQAPEPLSPMMEMVFERGVEIVSALAFVLLLFVSLRGGKVKGGEAGAGVPMGGGTGGGASAAGGMGSGAGVSANVGNTRRGGASAVAIGGGANGGGAAAGGTQGIDAAEAADIDPELLAVRQVEDLLATDPERVGKILSSWAREKGVARI